MINLPPPPYPKALRKSVSPLWWHGHKHSLWYLWNVQTEQAINVLEIRDEITLENRICTLGQAEVYMKAVESFVEDMNTPERARDSCPVYKADKDEWNR